MNTARHMDIDPEETLRKTTEKFIRRFRYIEERIGGADGGLKNATLEQMDALWNEAKENDV